MKSFLLSTIIVIQLISFTSCFSSLPVYYLKPVENNTEWENGKEIFRKNLNDITIFLSFDRIQDGNFIFDAEVHVFKKEVTISPEDFYLCVMKNKNDTATYRKYFANSPEIMLLDIQNKISEENSAYLNYLSGQVVLGFFEIVTDIATIGTPKTEEELDREQERNYQQEVSMSNRESFHKNELENLENNYQTISNYALRKTTLKNFGTVKGKIYFPVIYNAEYIKFFIPIGDETFTIVYQQIKYDNTIEAKQKILKPLK